MQSVTLRFTLGDLRQFRYFQGPADTNHTTFVLKGTSRKSLEGLILRKLVLGLGYDILSEADYMRDGDECEITTTVPWNKLYV